MLLLSFIMIIIMRNICNMNINFINIIVIIEKPIVIMKMIYMLVIAIINIWVLCILFCFWLLMSLLLYCCYHSYYYLYYF